MKFVLKIAEFIKKLQGLPEEKKKIILWTVVIILGLILSFFWITISKERLGKIDTKEMMKPLDTLIEKSQIPDGNEILETQDLEAMQELEKALQEAP
ncbi:hypothetical protein KJ786_03755 [Patescibacteria group bacterium]|nr:hypothetical protein [Patescibacteria group bacterium]